MSSKRPQLVAWPAWMRDFLADERGQVLPVVVVMLMVLLGFAGLVLDVGAAMIAQRALQSSTDAAAMAAAQVIPSAAAAGAATSLDPIAKALTYSSLSGDLNAVAALQTVTMSSGYPKLECLQTLKLKGLACVTVAVGSGSGQQANAIQVQQQAAVPMHLLSLFGKSTLTVTAMATASIRGGPPRPSNVAVILDATLSMNATDANCANLTQMQCALNGVQILLLNLSPCGVWQTTCGVAVNGNYANSFDRVSLFTFPNVSVGTAAIDGSCTAAFPAPTSQNGFRYMAPYGVFSMLPTAPYGGVPTSLPYSFPTPGTTYLGVNGNAGDPTYQVTSFMSDYRGSDASTVLNNASSLVKAAGGAAGCTGMAPPNYDGDYGTYYAGAIYAAQAALVAEQAVNPGSENVIIILSDGDSNAPQQAAAANPGTGYPNMSASPPAGENYLKATANGTYPSWSGECSQAVTAAQAATAAGTLVYSVAYGSEPTGCSTDSSPAMVPCDTMAGMASAPQYFFSDFLQTGSNSVCVASQPVTSLSGIFTAIAADLTEARLISNSVT
jgi:hypothetical protein